MRLEMSSGGNGIPAMLLKHCQRMASERQCDCPEIAHCQINYAKPVCLSPFACDLAGAKTLYYDRPEHDWEVLRRT